MKKTTLTSLLGLAICLPAIASAGTLNIYNYSTRDSTLKVTNGTNNACSSTLLGANGITKANGGHTQVSEGNMNMLCGNNKNDCHADIYMTNSCDKNGDPVIASAVFSTTGGIQSITPKTTSSFEFEYTKGGFTVTITGGPK